MVSLVRRAADKAVDVFVPKAEAKADTWGRFCGCRGTHGMFERWSYGPGGVPVKVGCLPRPEPRYEFWCEL